MLEKSLGEQKQLLAIAPNLIRGIFDVELTNVFLILSSYCKYFLLRFLPSTCIVTTCNQSCRQSS